MTTFRHNTLSEVKNDIGAKTYLEFAVHLLEQSFFNPIVFCHDRYWYDRKRYAQVMIGFINLLSFLYSCGVTIDTDLLQPSDIEAELYKHIMRDTDFSEEIRCYKLLESDFTNFNMYDVCIPENCFEEDFILVKLYLLLRTGVALNKKSIENVVKRQCSVSEILTLRKQLENITVRKIMKRKDNSYEMR